MSIIEVSNLSKAYRIGKKAERADSFVGMLQDSVTAPFRNWRRMRQPTGESRDSADELHWALRDVSFEVKEGEVLGVIGRNGAGKSTLLKILSRITEPTSGEVRIRGRVASLLEVGTGFHPELTGRENVYLNGTILGMHKAEIDRKFDEIVDFSGVEKFLDTPVKRYSSGMKVRLAFAVAAHLEPEILIVDEVLAVGDAEFQAKCLGKMDAVAHEGRTVIFVSHNDAAIRRLCDRAILLERGTVVFNNEPAKVLRLYRGNLQPAGFSDAKRVYSSRLLRITNAVLLVDGAASDVLLSAVQPDLQMTLEVTEKVTVSFEVLLRDAASAPVMFGPVGLTQGIKHTFVPGRYTVRFRLNLPRLAEGRYSLDLMAAESGVQFFDYLEDAIVLNAAAENNPQTGWRFTQSRGQGCILLETTPPEISEFSSV